MHVIAVCETIHTVILWLVEILGVNALPNFGAVVILRKNASSLQAKTVSFLHAHTTPSITKLVRTWSVAMDEFLLHYLRILHFKIHTKGFSPMVGTMMPSGFPKLSVASVSGKEEHLGEPTRRRTVAVADAQQKMYFISNTSIRKNGYGRTQRILAGEQTSYLLSTLN